MNLRYFLACWRTEFHFQRRDHSRRPWSLLSRWPGVSYSIRAHLLGFGGTYLSDVNLRSHVIEIGHLWLAQVSVVLKQDTTPSDRVLQLTAGLPSLYASEYGVTLTLFGVMFRFKVGGDEGARAWIVAGGKTRWRLPAQVVA